MFSPGDGLVLFVSMAPKSVGHYYRVVNHAEALVALGFDVNITSPDQVVPILESGKKISVLIFFEVPTMNCFATAVIGRTRMPFRYC